MFSFAGREAAGRTLQYRPRAGGLVFVARGGKEGATGSRVQRLGGPALYPMDLTYPIPPRPAMPTYEETESVKKISK